VRAVRSRKLASQMVSRAPKGRSKVTNGRQLFIDGGARLKVSRRFRDVLASIATDLGGADRLSEGQKQIARRCAMLSVECEIMESAAVTGESFDLDVYGQLTDRLGRAFQRLGLKRVMLDVTPDLGAYLTATAAGKPQDGLRAVAASENLFRVANERTTFADAFGMADQVLCSGISCITDLMVKEGLVNLDFADVCSIMSEMGTAMIGAGEAEGERRAHRAAEAAIATRCSTMPH
jgi:hypothetical protein